EMLVISVSFPASWDRFELTVTLGETIYLIVIEGTLDSREAVSFTLDQKPMPMHGPTVRLPLDGARHQVTIKAGMSEAASLTMVD
ncbi:MAG: hypothetical protein K2Y29_09330, partial [Beijerinckiaceae bacterium]|nr:hypothetical protein [Beijerinckiaceae bacterium]